MKPATTEADADILQSSYSDHEGSSDQREALVAMTDTPYNANRPATLIEVDEPESLPYNSHHSSKSNPIKALWSRSKRKAELWHGRRLPPWARKMPLSAIAIIALLVTVNLLVWAAVAVVLSYHPAFISTAVLSYTLGLRHALDADHISAIDLMTRRLLASNIQAPTVGTFFSLGHSTIVIITSIVVAGTSAAVSKNFNRFSTVGGIIGTSVSASFLIILGLMNGYILYKLVRQMIKVLNAEDGADVTWKLEGGGCLFSILKTTFRLIDRPWKMYPLGILFGLGFDTSSEIALLGISSIQGAKGTSIWLILIFPILFTSGMCLLDTLDGALMLTLYLQPSQLAANQDDNKKNDDLEPSTIETENITTSLSPDRDSESQALDTAQSRTTKSPLPYLYYSTLLTFLTLLVAIFIGTMQLLSLIQNVVTPTPTGRFWDGVSFLSDNYDIVGGIICGAFLVVGIGGWLGWPHFKRWAEGYQVRKGVERRRVEGEMERNDEMVRGEERV